MDDEHAYLDWSIEIPTIEGYMENPFTSIPHCVEHPIAHTHVEHPLLLLMLSIPLPSLLVSNNPILFLTTMVASPHLRSSLLSPTDLRQHMKVVSRLLHRCGETTIVSRRRMVLQDMNKLSRGIEPLSLQHVITASIYDAWKPDWI